MDTATDRAIPTLEGNCTKLDGDYGTRIDALQKCARCAKEMGMKIFSLQNGGWCAGTALDGEDYKKHGKSSDCDNDGLGAHSVNHVYKFNQRTGKQLMISIPTP